MDQEFEFLVEGMTREQADTLLDIILDYVEGQDLWMGGGFHAQTDKDYELLPILHRLVIEAWSAIQFAWRNR